ncbi:MAG: phosphate acetyltransferase [Proteobacteria bacterium]|nr:phosphate acetyltransferase [Pseudomonadota bacterium]
MALQVGQTAKTSRTFRATDIAGYVALGGQTTFNREVPEPLIGAMFSYLLGVKLPGMGTNYLKQESEFKSPAYIDQTLVACVEITRLRPEKHLVDLRTNCYNDGGDLICTGRALVYVEDVRQ